MFLFAQYVTKITTCVYSLTNKVVLTLLAGRTMMGIIVTGIEAKTIVKMEKYLKNIRMTIMSIQIKIAADVERHTDVN